MPEDLGTALGPGTINDVTRSEADTGTGIVEVDTDEAPGAQGAVFVAAVPEHADLPGVRYLAIWPNGGTGHLAWTVASEPPDGATVLNPDAEWALSTIIEHGRGVGDVERIGPTRVTSNGMGITFVEDGHEAALTRQVFEAFRNGPRFGEVVNSGWLQRDLEALGKMQHRVNQMRDQHQRALALAPTVGRAAENELRRGEDALDVLLDRLT